MAASLRPAGTVGGAKRERDTHQSNSPAHAGEAWSDYTEPFTDPTALFYCQVVGNRSPPRRSANASASSDLEKQNTTKSLSSRRREYVSGVADKAAAVVNITSLFLRPRIFLAGSAT
jgi:hypothetical protein